MVSNMEQTFKKMYEEAEMKGIEQVVRNMLAKNTSEDFIAEVTGLSKEQIKKIKNKFIEKNPDQPGFSFRCLKEGI